jgi:hypothetical protein
VGVCEVGRDKEGRGSNVKMGWTCGNERNKLMEERKIWNVICEVEICRKIMWWKKKMSEWFVKIMEDKFFVISGNEWGGFREGM